MTTSLQAAVFALLVAGGPAADPAPIDRAIRKEPAYRTKAPRYALLAFGPDGKDRVWLAHDGETLYVDRNGNGDLTDPGKAVSAKLEKDRNPDDTGYSFEVGELRVGPRLHKGLTVYSTPLSHLPDAVKNEPNAKAALAADPKTRVYTVSLDVDRPGYRGQGVGGRVMTLAGFTDGAGALVFANKPAAAPIIRPDGPLQITFYSETPSLKLGRDYEVVLVVGAPGHGPGTLAMIAYEDTIPAAAVPKVEIAFPAARAGDPPVRELYELKQRC
jgi:hypothetical protein